MRRSGACALLSLFVALGWGAPADDLPPLEYEVKAVFLLRIAQFTEWPAQVSRESSQPFLFCVIGEDPFGNLLDDTLRDERVAGQAAQVRRLGPTDPVSGCNLLFISGSLRNDIAHILARLHGAHTLTVADFEGFVGQGGAVELYVEQGFVRFRIDRDAARNAGLGLRSQLLRAAAAVEGG